MASQAYNFSTADFNVFERGVVGSTALGPITKLKIGMGLFRAIYEHRNVGIAQGALDTGPDRPSALLGTMNVQSRFSLAPGVSADVVFADDNGTVSYDFLGSDKDHMQCIVICIDGTYSSGDIACPEIKTWCEALGGTYLKAT